MEHRILSGSPGYHESWADDHAEGDFRLNPAFNRPGRALSQVLNDDLRGFSKDLGGDFELPDGDEAYETHFIG